VAAVLALLDHAVHDGLKQKHFCVCLLLRGANVLIFIAFRQKRRFLARNTAIFAQKIC
jgi:hypothetical protein